MTRKQLALISYDTSPEGPILASPDDERAFCAGGNTISTIGNPGDRPSIADLNRLLATIDATRFDVVLVEGMVRPSLQTLEELQDVHGIIDRHALVSPRTDDESPCGFGLLASPHDTATVLATAKDFLPRFERIVLPSHHCVLLDTAVLQDGGCLDEGCPSLETALDDFALRINAFGFDTVVANHAFLNVDAVNGPDADDPTDSENSITIPATTAFLNARYDYLESLMAYSAGSGRDACSVFFKELLPRAGRKPRILFNCSSMPPIHCGTSEYLNALLDYFFELYADRYEMSIYVTREAAGFHHFEERFTTVHYAEDDLELFDLGINAVQPVSIEEQAFLNRHCLRIIYTMFDAIILRCHYLTFSRDWSIEDNTRLGLETCDGIIAISDFSRDDYRTCFVATDEVVCKDALSVYLATDFGMHATSNGVAANRIAADEPESGEVTPEPPFERYVLIVGNPYAHKGLDECLEALRETDHNYIVVGTEREGAIADNVFGYPSSRLSEEFLDSLYARCELFIFPSLYEGFGLPITIALRHGKRVLLKDNQLNTEIYEHFPEHQGFISFFTTFQSLPDAVERTLDHEPPTDKPFDRSWRDVIIEIEGFVARVLDKKPDRENLERRWRTLNLIDRQMKLAAESVGLRKAFKRRFIEGHPLRERLFGNR